MNLLKRLKRNFSKKTNRLAFESRILQKKLRSGSKDQIHKFHDLKLRLLLNYVYKNNNYYRKIMQSNNFNRKGKNIIYELSKLVNDNKLFNF